MPTVMTAASRTKCQRRPGKSCHVHLWFVVGVNKRHQQSVCELNNMCLLGQNNCPTSVEGAVTHLSHCTDEKSKNCTGEPNDGHRETGFRQDNITCCHCRKPGHKVPDCPKKKNAEISDSDDDSVSASS